MLKRRSYIRALEEQLTIMVKDEEEYLETISRLCRRIDKAIEYIENKNVKMLNDIEILRILKGEE